MSLSSFFSEQARKPAGLFGRLVMPTVFDRGNAFLNRLVAEIMAVGPDDRVLEIGFGTGKLIGRIAEQIQDGLIEGVDVSTEMAAIARRKNRKHIATGKMNIVEGDFDELTYKNDSLTKVVSVNTIYFWPEPEATIKKILRILKPGGTLFLAFEDSRQLERRHLSADVFRLYNTSEVQQLLIDAGCSPNIRVESRTKGYSMYHCVIASK